MFIYQLYFLFLAVILLCFGCTETARFADNIPTTNIPSPLLIDPVLVAKDSSTLKIRGILSKLRKLSPLQSIVSLRIKIFKEGEKKPIFTADLSDNKSNEMQEWAFSKSLPEGVYTLELVTVDNVGNESLPATSRLVVDQTPPTIKIFLGANKSKDACASPPPTREKVATRLVPYDYCAKDQGAATSEVTGICVMTDPSASAPQIEDPCWKNPKDMGNLALLTNGANNVRAFARDGAENVGTTTGKIQLNVGKVPQLDILLPTTQSAAETPWKLGEIHPIRWKISGGDTAFENMKVIVTVQSAKDATRFQHLGCNFKNSDVWNQCPNPSLENSKAIHPGSETGTGEMDLTLPSTWNVNDPFLIIVTAIDESGNAAIVSTPEINAGYEVVAGTTYAGYGGSGTTVTRQGSFQETPLVVDKRGQVFDISRNLKLSAFDSRSCRYLKYPANSGATPFDCEDIIASDYPLTDYFWAYNRKKDVFYGSANGILLEIDFNHRKVTPILGLGGTELSPNVLNQKSISSAFKTRNLYSNLYYENGANLLYFRSYGQLYSIDENYHIQYVLGAPGDAVDYPPNVSNRSQNTIQLPSSNLAFGISSDNRLFFTGPRPLGTPTGGEQSQQYVLEDFSPTDPTHRANFFKLTGSDSPTNYYIKSIQYDPDHNQMVAILAWAGIYKMPLPPKGSSIDKYKWITLISGGAMSERAYLQNQTPGTSPIAFQSLFLGSFYAGAGIVVFANGYSGSVLQYDMAKNTLERLIGFPIGGESTQMGMNRRLDNPYTVFLDPNGDLVFSDYYNLQKIKLSVAGNSNPVIETIATDFNHHPFTFDRANGRILQTIGHGLVSYDYPSMTINSSSAPVPSASGYHVQFGFGNNPSRQKIFQRRSGWDAVRTFIYWSAAFIQDIPAAQFSWLAGNAEDAFTLNHPYCKDASGNQINCPQVAKTGNFYDGTHFRLVDVWATVDWRLPIGLAAFDATDENVFTCYNGMFVMQNIATQRIYDFTVVSPTGNLPSCGETTSVFKFINGNIYYSGGSAVYLLNTSMITSLNVATATPVKTNAPMFQGVYGDFSIDNSFIYYTDRFSHRVFRNRRSN